MILSCLTTSPRPLHHGRLGHAAHRLCGAGRTECSTDGRGGHATRLATQKYFCLSYPCRRRLWLCGVARSLARQREGEGRSLSLHTLDCYRAFVRLYNLLDNVQPQPRASSFGRIERLKNLRQVGGRNTTAGILDMQANGTGRTLANQPQRPPLRHGVQGVLHQVEYGAP